MKKIRLQSVQHGMHQPVPDPYDMREENPVVDIVVLCALQRAMADAEPFGETIGVGQERPGVFRLGNYPNTIVIGLNRVLSYLQSAGAINIYNRPLPESSGINNTQTRGDEPCFRS